MRARLLSFTAVVAAMAAPVAVADATTTKAALDLIAHPSVCGPAETARDADPVAGMVMVPGFGSGGFPVDTTNPEAQAWFNHGVRLRWAFEHTESVRAFRKARQLDPDCGMCAWGEAWAIGPNLNGGGMDDGSNAKGLAAARDARRLARDATPVQRQMIDALIQRYSGSKKSRAQRFARAMDRIQRRNPDDVAVAAATADAWMLKADDWWDKDGKPADLGIARAMAILEATLAAHPDDPGAIHLYIHLTEWSADPHKAIPYGERLAALAPGASHLVHMPSHTFFRVGRYKDAMRSNINAVGLDRAYEGQAPRPGGIAGGMPLHGHNIHFGMGGALMSGAGDEGLQLADWFLSVFPNISADNAWRQIMANDAYALYGRFGDQAAVAALAEPPASNPMQRASWRYARGEAAARRGDAQAVAAEAAAIGQLLGSLPTTGRNAGDMRDFVELFQRVLEGRSAMAARDWAGARTAFTRAAAIQAKGGNEGGDPPIVWYPTRRSLAAAMLASGDAAGAKAKVEELLKDWPNDPYSYFVLAQAEQALGHADAATEAMRMSRQEWLGGEMSLALA